MPTPEQWAKVRTLFAECEGLDAADRETRISAEPDRVVGEQVRSLFGVDPGTSFLTPPFATEVHVELDDYELKEEIGRGGMGIIRAAVHIASGREVAIKLLQVPSKINPVLARMLRREAIRAFALRHPGIVRIERVGEEQSGPFIVMERIKGPSLEKLLKESSKSSKPGASIECPNDFGVPQYDYPRRVGHLLARIAEALHYSHVNRVVHRDIKPSNILIDESGKPMITDFGIATDLDHETRAGGLVGTVHYMSPEQAKVRAGEIDHRTDIYSLGVVGYQLLTLALPFEGETDIAVLDAIQHATPVPIRSLNRSVPPTLEAVLNKAMSRARDYRYESAQAFAEDLCRFVDGEKPLAKPPTWIDRGVRAVSVHRRIAWASGLLPLIPLLIWASLKFDRHFDLPLLEIEFQGDGVSVTCSPMGSSFLQVNGEPLSFESTPIEKRFDPGWWRISCVDASGDTSETYELLLNGESVQVPSLPRSLIDPTEMIVIPVEGSQGFIKGMKELGPFAMDLYEVTNEDYRRFLDRTNSWGERKPYYWPEESVESWWNGEIASKPVSGVSFTDADAYARWLGKRLPTRYEWLWAAQGPNRASYVWGEAEPGDESEPLAAYAVKKLVSPDDPFSLEGRATLWKAYCEDCPKCGAFPTDRSHCGVFDLQGSLREWTMHPREVGEGDARDVVLSKDARYVTGGGFRFELRELGGAWPMPVNQRDSSTGFRCAKTIR